LTVTENIILGLEPKSGLKIDYKKAKNDIIEISKKYGLTVNPDLPVGHLAVGLQQRVEILKLLYRGANILILDEPTAVLTPQETEDLFKTLRSLKEQGKTIIIITHKLNEVIAITDDVSVLKQGKNAGFTRTADTNKGKLAQMMVGRDVLLKVERTASEIKDKVLEVKNVRAKNNLGEEILKGISFSIRGGEVLGLAGIEGNGQSELAEVLSGLRPVTTGDIILSGQNIANRSVRKIKENGFSFIPEDRLKRGLVLNYSTRDNLILGFHYLSENTKGPFLNFEKMEQKASLWVEKHDIRPRDYSLPVKNLSGGNQQKVIIAR
jgi:general nucleoside transport system ATP-binding protein